MAFPRLTEAEIIAQIPAAEARARRSLRTKPHAKSARYLRTSRSLRIELTNGASLVFPVSMVEDLAFLSDAELAEVEVGPFGIAVSWERLDIDLSVAGLVRVVIGAHTLLKAAGAAGGSSRSKAKTKASRANGLKGGRPRLARK